jgi:intergrase/recombinase
MSRLIEAPAAAAPSPLLVGAHVFDSLPSSSSPTMLSSKEEQHIDWQQFNQFLLQRMTKETAEDRIRYAKQYASVLWLGIPRDVLQLSPNKRIHVMKALSALARFTGRTEQWRQVRQRYGLQWSTGTEKIDAFTRFFDSSKDLDTMIGWLKEAIQVLPKAYANFFLFCTLTGLRASECVESVRLLNDTSLSSSVMYYNPEQMILQHYRFPDIFIRRTKAVYISIVDNSIVGIAQSIKFTPTLNALKMQSRRTSPMSMRLKYCRKIYASWLHRCGISDSLIDMLQGRIGKNIFLKHYLTPTRDFKDQVLQALEQLRTQL